MLNSAAIGQRCCQSKEAEQSEQTERHSRRSVELCSEAGRRTLEGICEAASEMKFGNGKTKDAANFLIT